MIKVLFVCLGNICRSPAAEGVLRHLIKKYELEDKIMCESAGTSAHVDEPADARMQRHAELRGYKLDRYGQQFSAEHFEKFDYIITMDHSNLRNVHRHDPKEKYRDKVIPLSHFCETLSITEVPDPYYGGDAGFEEVLDIVQDGCMGLLKRFSLIPD